MTLPSPTGVGTFDIMSPDGTTLSASISPNAGIALPSKVEFPYDFLTFTIEGLQPGQAADLTISGLDLSLITDYYKYGATPANPNEHWYNFLFGVPTDGDSAIGTGMEIVGNNIVLHLVDGGRGDDDLAQNGVIFDIGGPAISSATVISTQTVLTSDHAAGSTYGQLVQFTATVNAASGTPTGSVQFTIDGQNFGPPQPLNGGSASLSISTLSASDHAIAAFYDSDTSGFADPKMISYSTSVGRCWPFTPPIRARFIAPLPTLTANYSGFVNGETPAVLSAFATLDTTATAASHVGNYSITVNGAAATNYTFNYQVGTLSVTPAMLTIKADDKSKAFGACSADTDGQLHRLRQR